MLFFKDYFALKTQRFDSLIFKQKNNLYLYIYPQKQVSGIDCIFKAAKSTSAQVLAMGNEEQNN